MLYSRTLLVIYFIFIFLNIYLFIWQNWFYKFIFNWRIIALQYCVGFCHISTWNSHRVIHFKYGSLYMSTPNSITIPSPYSFHTATVSSFSKSVSFLIKFISIISFQVPYVRDCICYFSFFAGLHWVTISRSIHVAANGLISFFLMAE